jgi:DNA-binding NarL/FixJ family response regulator
MSRSSAITVSLVEDDAEIGIHLASLLRGVPQMELLGIYSTVAEAIAGISQKPTQVAVVDINLPDGTGIQCVEALKAARPGMQFLMLTVYEDSESIFNSLRAGASGYLVKRSAPEQLVRAIREVHEGGSPMTSQIARKVVQFFQHNAERKNFENLSAREMQVLEKLAKGRLYKEIADDLNVTTDTVSKHVQGIYRKLHVHTRTEAVAKYLGRSNH